MPKTEGQGNCARCGAKCCRYVTVEIDRPRARIDHEEIRWFLAHENVVVFIDADDRTWHMQFHSDCRHLDARGRCRIYRRRYQVCSEHDTEDCEASECELADTMFRTTEDYDAWRRKRQAEYRRRKRRRLKGRPNPKPSAAKKAARRKPR